MPGPAPSVVMPAYQEPRRLGKTLGWILAHLAERHPGSEIPAVDVEVLFLARRSGLRIAEVPVR